MAWKCPKGHTWDSTVVSRTSDKKRGCPECAEYGFSPIKTRKGAC